MHEEEEWDQTSEASRAMKGLRSFPSVDTRDVLSYYKEIKLIELKTQ